jgi:hypothetical protein
MFRNRLVAIAVAALAAFVLSSLYYSPRLAGDLWRAVDPVAVAGMTPSLWKVVAEILRTIVITCVVAHLVVGGGRRSALKTRTAQRQQAPCGRLHKA